MLMRNIRSFFKLSLTTLLLGAFCTSCGHVNKQVNGGDSLARTAETEALLKNLMQSSARGIMFGHHDDTLYGIGWEGDEGRSDVKSVCGDYPAVISFDLGELEIDSMRSLDKVPFEKIRQEIVNQYERGGLASISWHLRNPKTGGDAWDVSDSTVVRSVLPEGECHEKFCGWLKKMADFLNTLQTKEGVKVPVLFRPWHEHTGSWFWWGQDLCSDEEYISLWRMTVDSLRVYGVDNALYAYSSSSDSQNASQYLARYPGDDYIDVVGFDTYQFDREQFLGGMDRMLKIVTEVAEEHHKVPALTEVGYEAVPDSTWWTGTLLPAIEKYPIAYALVWRNAREKVGHYYAPYPGQVSADDFVSFYKNPKTLFAGDVNLYK